MTQGDFPYQPAQTELISNFCSVLLFRKHCPHPRRPPQNQTPGGSLWTLSPGVHVYQIISLQKPEDFNSSLTPRGSRPRLPRLHYLPLSVSPTVKPKAPFLCSRLALVSNLFKHQLPALPVLSVSLQGEIPTFC